MFDATAVCAVDHDGVAPQLKVLQKNYTKSVHDDTHAEMAW